MLLSNQEIGKLLSVMLDEKDGVEVVAAALEEDDVLAAEEDDDDDVSGFNGVAGYFFPTTGLPMSLLFCSTIVIFFITRNLIGCFVISLTITKSEQVNTVFGFRSPLSTHWFND